MRISSLLLRIFPSSTLIQELKHRQQMTEADYVALTDYFNRIYEDPVEHSMQDGITKLTNGVKADLLSGLAEARKKDYAANEEKYQRLKAAQLSRQAAIPRDPDGHIIPPKSWTTPFRPGDIVTCTNPTLLAMCDKMFQVESLDYGMLRLLGVNGTWDLDCFRLATDDEKRRVKPKDIHIEDANPAAPFNPGDFVRYKHNIPVYDVHPGDVDQVINAYPGLVSGTHFIVLAGHDAYFSAKDFELVPVHEPIGTITVQPFQPGDKVRCVDPMPEWGLILGRQYTVATVFNDPMLFITLVKIDSRFLASRFEKEEEDVLS